MKWEVFVGCDVSQDTFTFFARNRAEVLWQGELANTSRAIRSWIAQLKRMPWFEMGKAVFCMEHTGVYSAILCRELHKSGSAISLEAAIQIKNSLGLQRGKNDKIDAARIAEYAMRYTDRLRLWQPRRAALKKLQVLCSSRARLVKARAMITRFNNDAKRFCEKEISSLVTKSTQASVEAIDQDIDSLDRQIRDLLKADENLNRLTRLVTSVPGVGVVTCCELILRTKEFTAFQSAKQIACTAGIAPFEYSSGSSIRGKSRVSHRAHKQLKTLLHLCAMSAIHTTGEIQNYYQRKVAEGKNKMLVINAVRNKIVHLIFALVRDNTMYQKNYHYALA